VLTGAGRVFQYQPTASVARIAATAIMRFVPTGALSSLMPSGVTSRVREHQRDRKTEQDDERDGRGAHSGRLSCGATVEATWISSQPTTR
jgi:hypothetical protein